VFEHNLARPDKGQRARSAPSSTKPPRRQR
jgi:hypothetical protein